MDDDNYDDDNYDDDYDDNSDRSVFAFLERNRRIFGAENREIIRAHINDEDFGLCYEKPVFVRGIDEARRYIDSLTTDTGRALYCERESPARQIPGIAGLVDCYHTFRMGRYGMPHFYRDIFICEYSEENVWKAPKGFLLGMQFDDGE